MSTLDYLNGNSYLPWGIGTFFLHVVFHGGLAYWSNKSIAKMWGTWFGWTVINYKDEIEIEEWLKENILPNRWIRNYSIYVFLSKSDATYFKMTWA